MNVWKKRMLYCPGNREELLSVLGVTHVCHASNVFLVLKVPLSLIVVFSKSMVWLLDQASRTDVLRFVMRPSPRTSAQRAGHIRSLVVSQS